MRTDIPGALKIFVTLSNGNLASSMISLEDFEYACEKALGNDFFDTINALKVAQFILPVHEFDPESGRNENYLKLDIKGLEELKKIYEPLKHLAVKALEIFTFLSDEVSTLSKIPVKDFDDVCQKAMDDEFFETINALKVADFIFIDFQFDPEVGYVEYYKLKDKGLEELEKIYGIKKPMSKAELKSKISGGFNIIRGSVEVSDYHIILYLLTLHRYGFLKNSHIVSHADLNQQIKEWTDNLENVPLVLSSSILFYELLINEVDIKTISEVFNLLASLNQTILEEHFAEIFDDLLHKLLQWGRREIGEFLLPLELSRFVSSLAKLPKIDETNNPWTFHNVYNPFAGLASFELDFKQGEVLYYGQELNRTTWLIGSLRLLAYDRVPFLYTEENSLENWRYSITSSNSNEKQEFNDLGKFDLVISNPPFGKGIPKQLVGKFGKISSYEHFLIENGMESLKANGKLIAVLSQGFLFRSGSEKNLRQFLTENDLLDMIISFPGGLLMHTGIPFIVLVINKNKENKGVVSFVDANNCIKPQSKSENVLDGKALANIIKSNDKNAVRIVRNQTIVKNDFNFSVSRYFQDSYEGVQLKDLVQIIRVKRHDGSVTGKFIRITELRDDKFDYALRSNDIQEINVPGVNQVISESCLLIASIGEKLKPTYFNFSNEVVHVSSTVFAFKVDEKKVDLDYLITELSSDRTMSQIKSVLTGAVMPRLKREDFLSIKIELPSLPEQKAKVKGLKEEHIKSREKELALVRQLLGIKDDAFREFASIKHTFSQYLNALKSNVSGTVKFIKANDKNAISLSTVYSAKLNRTLGEHLLSLEGTIDSMSRLLNTDDERPSASTNEEFDLPNMVKEAQNRFQNPEVFQFEEFYIDWETFSPAGDEFYTAPLVWMRPDDFYRVFSNIISNAVNHGFKNRTSNNLIRVTLSLEEQNKLCILEIANNGHPMPDNFTLKHLTTRGEKTVDSKGSGVGGADIKKILENYNGGFDIKNDPESAFPVTYILKIPLVFIIL